MLAAVENRTQGKNIYTAIFDFIDSNTKPDEDKKEIKERVTKTANTFEQYASMLQGNAINDFISTGNRQLKKDIQAGTATAEKNNTLMTFENDVNLSPNMRKFLMALLVKLTSQLPKKETDANKINEARRVSFTVYDYMNWTGTKDRTQAYKHINDGVKNLLKTTKKFNVVTYEPDRKGNIVKKEQIREMNILEAVDKEAKDGKAIKDGRVTIYFSFLMAQALSHSHVMKLPTEILKTNSTRHPNSVNLGYKLALHYDMNSKKKNKNANLISVKSLLAFCPEIQSYAEVMAKPGRKVSEKIIDPFTRDLDDLQQRGILSKWHYCDTNGKPLPQEQLDKFNYANWIEWQVFFEMKNHPREKKA